MATANILLTNTAINSGTPVRIVAPIVNVSGTKNLTKTPIANGTDYVEVQTNSYENFTYSISNAYLTHETNTLTWNDVITLYKQQYDGTNYSTLNVTYGDGTALNGLSESSDIKVILNTVSIGMDTRGTKNSYRPVMNLTFVETK